MLCWSAEPVIIAGNVHIDGFRRDAHVVDLSKIQIPVPLVSSMFSVGVISLGPNRCEAA